MPRPAADARTGVMSGYVGPVGIRLTSSSTSVIRVAGHRWTIEESFQTGKGLAGLDEHQVRRWTSWRRWTLLAMLAHALLVVIAANEHTGRRHQHRARTSHYRRQETSRRRP